MKDRILILNSYESGGGAESVYRITCAVLKESMKFDVFTASNATLSDKDDSASHLTLFDTKCGNRFNFLLYIFSFKNFFLLVDFINKNKINRVLLHNYLGNLSPSVMWALKYLKSKRKLKIFQYLHDYHLVCPNSSLFNFSKSESCVSCVEGGSKLNIIFNNCSEQGILVSILKLIRYIVLASSKPKDVVDLFIAPSNFMIDKLSSSMIKMDKQLLLRNPINFEIPSHLEIKIIPEGVVHRIVYIGRLSPEKDIETLLLAFSLIYKKSSNYYLTIIGDGPDRNRLQDIVKNIGLTSVVEFKGFVDQRKMLSILKQQHTFVLPSKCYENMPMSLIEALASGLYPIASDHGGMKELISNFNVGGVFEPQNEFSLATEIERRERLSRPISVEPSIFSSLSLSYFKRQLINALN